MKKTIAFLALFLTTFLFGVETASAQTVDKPNWNDKTDIAVTYQFERKESEVEVLTPFAANAVTDQHGGQIALTYFPKNKSLGFTQEVTFTYNHDFGTSNRTFSYQAGGVLQRRNGNFRPFVKAVGGLTVGRVITESSEFVARSGDNGLSFAVGGGVDYKISKNTAWRVFSVDYTQAHIYGGETRGIRVGTGIVF